MKQNDVQPLANAPAAPSVLASVPRARSETADAAATGRTGRTRPAPVDTAGVPAAVSSPPVPGPDLLLPASAPPVDGPDVDLLYETAKSKAEDKAEDKADDTREQNLREKEAAEKRLVAERDKANAERDTEMDAQRKALLIHEEAPQPVQTASLLLIDPNESSAESRQSASAGKPKRHAGSGMAFAGGLDESDIGAPGESGDRLHRVAVVAHLWLQELRAPRMKSGSSISAARPKSRAECQRRCGHDGFCDPSDPHGCGGVHCGHKGDMLY